MTNREAIEILEEVKVVDDSIYAYNPVYAAALDMAIDSLRASPAASCGDKYDHLKLGPCPFCGEPVRYVYDADLEPDGITCVNCHIIVRFPRAGVRRGEKFEAAMRRMAEIWNRRTT